jgi:hypothetical protein
MAVDFLDALVDAWSADAALAAAGIGLLHYGVDPEGGYPFAVASDLGGRKPLRTFGKGQVHEKHYRFNISATSKDEAAALGKLALTFLESLKATPPTFDEGRLTDSHQNGDMLIVANRWKPGISGVPLVWLCSLVWTFKITRDRAS